MFAPSPMASSWFPSLLPWSLLKKYVCPALVLNCWLNLVASCLDDENEIPLKVIASFSASPFALPSIPLIVLHSLVTSVIWSMVSTKSIFAVCVHICGSGWLYSILAVQVRWGLSYGGHLVCSSRPVSLLVQLPHGVCGGQ